MQIALLEQALQMPDAYLFIDRLQAALEPEKATRKHFYEIVEENRKMEFINGEIYYHSPVRLWHNEASGNIYELLRTYVRRNKLGRVGIENLLISLTRNDYDRIAEATGRLLLGRRKSFVVQAPSGAVSGSRFRGRSSIRINCET